MLKKLEEIDKLLGKDILDNLLSVIKPNDILRWFYQSNKAFNDKSPYELCMEGKKEELEKAIYYLTAGEAF